MKTIRILWQSRTPVVSECFRQQKLLPAANGGNAYDVQSAWQLSSKFDVTMSEVSIKRPGEGMISYWTRMQRIRDEAEVVIREPYPVVFGRFSKNVRYIGVVHHIDDQLSRKSIKHRWYFARLKKRLSALDLVVTVSEYWAEYLRGIGCRNVRVIYNSFNPADYAVPVDEVRAFVNRVGLPTDRPIIYIGNASRQKGVYEVYHALKDAGYHLVMSGPKNLAPDLPVHYLCLDRADYLRLLNACSAVVCMSQITEGWNRIAHEAMLCNVPVIGNGKGGMLELLRGGGQAVVVDTKMLADVIASVLKDRKQVAAHGLHYASKFNLEYFRKAWVDAVEAVLTK